MQAFNNISSPLVTGNLNRKARNWYSGCDFTTSFGESEVLVDGAEKSPVSHTVLARSQQHLYNKKKRPYKEHRCGAGQVPSEGRVRIFSQL